MARSEQSMDGRDQAAGADVTARDGGNPGTSLLRRAYWLPLPIFATTIAILGSVRIESLYNPGWLFTTLNVLFLTCIGLIVSILAARSFLAKESWAVLFLGMGALALALGAACAALKAGGPGDNPLASTYNSSALLASACHLIGIILGRSPSTRRSRVGSPWALASYVIVALLILVLILLIRNNWWPVQLMSGQGPTNFGLAVLWVTMGLFALSAVLLLLGYRTMQSRFHYWYGLGLALIVVGLVAVSLQKNVGDPLNWVGRLSQYLGGVYLFLSVLPALRQKAVRVMPLERALREAENRYQALFEVSPDAVLVTSGGKHVFVNQAAAKLFGARSLSELVGRDVLDLVRPEDREVVAGWVDQALVGEIVPLREMIVLRIDGSPVEVEATGTGVEFDGEPAALWILRDVTARKRTEEALRRYREELEQRVRERTIELTIANEAAQDEITERRRVEEELAASQSELHEVHRLAQLGVWFWDPATDVVTWNEELFRISGRDPQHGAPSYEEHPSVYAPESWGRLQAVVEEALESGKSYNLDLEMLRPNGERRWTNAWGGAERDPTGKVLRLRGTVQDITERKLAERELQITSQGIEHAGLGLMRLSQKGHITQVNDYMCKLLGYSPEELLGLTAFDVTVGLDAGTWPERWQELRAAGPVTFEKNYRAKDGRIIPVEISSAIVEFDGVEYDHGFIRDITERKRAEEALRASEANMRYIIKHDPSAIAVFDRELRYIDASDRYIKDYEIDGDNIVGRHHYEVFPEIPQKWRDVHQRVLAGAIEREEDDSFVRIDGSLTYNTWECRPWYEADGSIGGIITYTEVTTERKAAEETLREREEQLRQSQKMEAVGQLAGGIAHDFNNLLTAILGYSDMILADQTVQGLPLRDDVQEIKKAAERAASLTKQILAFSRRQALRPEVVSLSDVVAGMESLLRRTLGEDVELLTNLDPDLGQIEVDVHQIEQVLMNLAVNARDAMPAGGTLTLKTANVELSEEYCEDHPDAAPGPHVMLAVFDTGVGMDEATLGHIFEPFFTTKGVGEGTGLGLATVYGTVRQSGGSIAVESEPGRGTTFEIYVPRVSERPLAHAPIPLEEPHQHAGATILVVEDEDALRSLVARVLSQQGYTVLSAPDAAEGLKIAETERSSIDLLLIDMTLPGVLQGSDLAAEVLARRPGLPIIFMSGYAQRASDRGDWSRNDESFLEKPFTPTQLISKVGAALERDR